MARPRVTWERDTGRISARCRVHQLGWFDVACVAPYDWFEQFTIHCTPNLSTREPK